MLHIEKPMGLGDGRSGIRVEPGSTLLGPAESVVLVGIIVAGVGVGATWIGEKIGEKIKEVKKRTA